MNLANLCQQLREYNIDFEAIFQLCARDSLAIHYPGRANFLNSMKDNEYFLGLVYAAQTTFVGTLYATKESSQKSANLQFANELLYVKFPQLQDKFLDAISNFPQLDYSEDDAEVVSMVVLNSVYEHMLVKAKEIKEASIGEQMRVALNPEDPGALLMIAGAAFARIIRVFRRQQRRRLAAKEPLSRDIQRMILLLSRSKMSPGQKRRLFGLKTDRTDFLKHYDMGFLYIPQISFLPYLRTLCSIVCQHCNSQGFSKHKQNMVKETKSAIKRQDDKLRNLFDIALKKAIATSGIRWVPYDYLIEKLYSQVTRKVANTRIEEFMSAMKEKQCEQYRVQLRGGINLRDRLYQVMPKIHRYGSGHNCAK